MTDLSKAFAILHEQAMDVKEEVALEVLKKLLTDELKSRSRKNLLKSKSLEITVEA